MNEQWPEYWAQRFSARGYCVIDAIRPRIWDDPDVERWYAQNALLFVRQDRVTTEPELIRLSAATHRSQLSVVHPRKYLDMLDWNGRIEQTRRDLADMITPGASFVFVDSAQLEAALPPARHPIPFLERDGQYGSRRRTMRSPSTNWGGSARQVRRLSCSHGRPFGGLTSTRCSTVI